MKNPRLLQVAWGSGLARPGDGRRLPGLTLPPGRCARNHNAGYHHAMRKLLDTAESLQEADRKAREFRYAARNIVHVVPGDIRVGRIRTASKHDLSTWAVWLVLSSDDE